MRKKRESSSKEETIMVLAPEDAKTEIESLSERGEKAEKRTAVEVVGSEKRVGEDRESLVEISEILRDVDRLTVEMYDVRIAEAKSPEEMQEILKDMNALLELREAEPCKPPCKHIDDLGDKEELGHANQVYLLRLVERGRELTGIYKPVKGEWVEVRNKKRVARVGIKDFSFYQREWLAFMVDRALDLDVVPPTVLRDEDEGLGSVQSFIEDADPAVKVPERQKNPEDLIKVALLHKLTGQQDGNFGNILVGRGPKGETYAIDNGLSFGAALYDTTGKEVFPALHVFSKALGEAKDISIAVQAPLLEIHLRKFFDSPQRQEALKRAFNFVLGNDSEGVWGTFIKTAKYLLERGQLPRDYDVDAAKILVKYGSGQEYFGATTKREMAEAA